MYQIPDRGIDSECIVIYIFSFLYINPIILFYILLVKQSKI